MTFRTPASILAVAFLDQMETSGDSIAWCPLQPFISCDASLGPCLSLQEYQYNNKTVQEYSKNDLHYNTTSESYVIGADNKSFILPNESIGSTFIIRRYVFHLKRNPFGVTLWMWKRTEILQLHHFCIHATTLNIVSIFWLACYSKWEALYTVVILPERGIVPDMINLLMNWKKYCRKKLRNIINL